MGNILYKIKKVHPSVYDLTITKKRLILLDETYNQQFQIPFLDFILSLEPKNILSLFVDCVTKKLDIKTIFEKKDEINSFFYLFTLYIDDQYNKNKIDDYNRYLDTIIPLNLKSVDEYNHVFKDYIKYLDQEYSECSIKISVTNSVILKITSKDYIREIENKISDAIIDASVIIIKELYAQFNKECYFFYNNCFDEVVKDNPKKKQFLDILFEFNKPLSQEIKSGIDKILKKNPDLKKPNIINLSGELLVRHLRVLVRRFKLADHGWEVFHFERGNVFYPHNEPDGFYYVIKLQSLTLFANKYYFNLKSYYSWSNSYNHLSFIDINIPYVKQVYLSNTGEVDDVAICLELKNFEDENSINDNIEYVAVLNEDRIPCLMDLVLFEKFEIDNKLIYSAAEIGNEIANKMDVLKNITIDMLQDVYINEFINDEYSECNFINDFKKITEINELIFKNFHFIKTQAYFLHQLFHRYQKDILVISESHQFVIPNTKEQENVELGRRTEWVVDRFLRNFIESDKWYHTIDEDDPKKKVTDYPQYSFGSIPVSKIVWNNQSSESFKPFDFQITFGNVEYKIEVKSTRGDEENVFYISVKELEELLKDPGHYLILRLSYIQKLEMYYGIQFNDEFYGRFYKIKSETLRLVKNKLVEWKEYYKTDTIRFTVDQFELIPDTYDVNSKPNMYTVPSVLNSRYWYKYEEFVQNKYFSSLESILDTYSVLHEVAKMREDFFALQSDVKFHFALNLIEQELVFPDEVEDITVENDFIPPNPFNSSPVEDDLPF